MRVFLAIPISENIKDKILKVQREIVDEGIKLVGRENLHITLRFFGELEEEEVKRIIEILNSFEYPQFKIKIKGIGTFPNINFIRIIWIGIEGEEIHRLKISIDNFLTKINLKREELWKPHLTIARVKFLKNKKKLVDKISSLSEYEIGFEEVSKIVLYESILKKPSPIYKEIYLKHFFK